MHPQQIEGLEATAKHREQLEESHPLMQLFWEFTLRCNMSCLHCGSDCLKDVVSPDMPLADFLPVLDEIAGHLDDPSQLLVNTVGGEPLVRRDLAECGKAIKQRGFRWGLVTNGFLLDDKMAATLAEAGIDCMAIDLDGTKDEHNWLRNNPLAFDRAMRAIAAAQTIPGLVWDVITCVNPRNIDKLDETKQMLIDAGVKQWRCFSIDPMGRAKDNTNLAISDEQLAQLLNFIVSTRLEGKIDVQYACEGYLGAYEGLARDHFFRCDAGTTVASIRANGDISGCLSIRSDYHQGNIYRDSFWEVWQNRFKPYRDRSWMKKGPCASCEAFRYCQGNGFHLRDENGDLMHCHYQRLKNVKI